MPTFITQFIMSRNSATESHTLFFELASLFNSSTASASSLMYSSQTQRKGTIKKGGKGYENYSDDMNAEPLSWVKRGTAVMKGTHKLC